MAADELVKVFLHTVWGGIHGHYLWNGSTILGRLDIPSS